MATPPPEPLRIRHVRAGEEQPLRELRLAALATNPEAFGSSYALDAARTPQWWRQWAAASGDGIAERTYVAEDERARWRGLALVKGDADHPDTARLFAMWVSPEVRGRGGAVSLCDACADWARERGFGRLVLNVKKTNQPARSAYARAGFEVSATAPEELVMSRRL